MVVIYGLKNASTGRVYVGCTSGKTTKRFREHRCLLNNSKHKEQILQKEWLLYGPDAFVMEILEVLPENAAVAEKRQFELKWMQKFEIEGLLYNQNKISFGFTREATLKGIEASRYVGRPVSAEGRLKRRLAQLGIPKNHGAKISATKRKNRISKLNSDEIV